MKNFKLVLIISLFITSSQFFAQKIDLSDVTVKPMAWGQIDYVNDIQTDTETFFLKKIDFGVKGSLSEHLGYHILLEMGNGSTYLRQAWIDYKINKLFNVRVGQYKYPFGIEAYSSPLTWKFINVSKVSGKIVKKLGTEGNLFRDIGIQLSGTYGFNKENSFNYKVMVMNGNGLNTKDNNKNKDYTGRVSYNHAKMLEIGASVFAGTYHDQAADKNFSETAFGADVQLNTMLAKKAFHVQGEFISSNYERIVSDLENQGFYLQSTYFIYSDKVELGARYDSFTQTVNDVDTDIWRGTWGVSYHIEGKQRITLNHEYIEDDTINSKYNLYTVQFQFSIN